MNKFRIILTFLVVGSAFLTSRAEYYGPQYHVYLFKPLTMVFILVIAILSAKENLSRYTYAIIGGLLCSLVGDIFLMLPSDQFIAGLVSFLVAHLFYIAAFTTGIRIRILLASLTPFIIYGFFMVSILFPYLGGMKLPVMVYMVVILIMGWTAWERWSHTRQSAALMAFSGAVLFIISDSIIAINRFREQFDLARALILIAYFTAQWLIALSVKQKPALQE